MCDIVAISFILPYDRVFIYSYYLCRTT